MALSGPMKNCRDMESGATKTYGTNNKPSSLASVSLPISDDLCLTSRSVGSRESTWTSCGLTNFHIYFCLGMIGFVIFWGILLLRIYLPEQFVF